MKVKWILTPALVGATVMAGYATYSASQPPFTFVSDLRGERIARPWDDAPDPSRRNDQYYGFRAPVRVVEGALRAEMKQRNWRPVSSCFGGIERYSEGDVFSTAGYDWDTDYSGVTLWSGPSTPMGYTCLAIYDPGDSWLDRKWRILKKWMHPKAPSEK